MKKLVLSLFVVAAVTVVGPLSSCKMGCIKGSGKQDTRTFKLADITGVDIEGGYKVVLKQDGSNTVALTADDNLFDDIKVTNNGGKLHIYSKRNFCTDGDLKLVIGVKDLQLLKLSGAMDVKGEGEFKTQDLKIDLAGSNHVDMNVNAANIVTEASGASEIGLSGQATSHTVGFSGSGKLKAFDLVVGKYSIESSGVADCEVNVLNELNVNSSGASDIKYKGHPASIHNEKSGAGSLKHVE